jgi:hypothetical protein
MVKVGDRVRVRVDSRTGIVLAIQGKHILVAGDGWQELFQEYHLHLLTNSP